MLNPEQFGFCKLNVVAGAVEAMEEKGRLGRWRGTGRRRGIGDGSLLRIGGKKHGWDGRKKARKDDRYGKDR